MQVNVQTAKATLSELILRAEAGEDVEITRRGQTVARLVAVTRNQARKFGLFSSMVVKGDVVAPLDDAGLQSWEGSRVAYCSTHMR